MFVLFKPRGVSEDFLRSILRKAEEISGSESVECDVCLIGSYARGDASPLSDVDLVLFADGESALKRTEIFHIGEKMITVFPVNIRRLLEAEAIDFYCANNPFEAKLIIGEGRVLDTLRRGIHKKKIDLNSTRRITGRTVSTRLMAALSDAALDYGEGLRNMRTCLAKAKLYRMLFKEAVDPWSIIPYHYRPEDDLENLVERLYYSESYDELSSKIANLNLRGLMEETFQGQIETMLKVAEKITAKVGFAGRHVENYVKLYLIIEEKVKAEIWSRLPTRWKIEEELNSRVNHYQTTIACSDGRVYWILSTGEGGDLKLKHYGTTEF